MSSAVLLAAEIVEGVRAVEAIVSGVEYEAEIVEGVELVGEVFGD